MRAADGDTTSRPSIRKDLIIQSPIFVPFARTLYITLGETLSFDSIAKELGDDALLQLRDDTFWLAAAEIKKI